MSLLNWPLNPKSALVSFPGIPHFQVLLQYAKWRESPACSFFSYDLQHVCHISSHFYVQGYDSTCWVAARCGTETFSITCAADMELWLSLSGICRALAAQARCPGFEFQWQPAFYFLRFPWDIPCLPTPFSPTHTLPTLGQNVMFHLLI